MIEHITYKMEIIASELFAVIPEAEDLYLFGSRRHRTRSERSDIDLLLKHKGYVKPMYIREQIEDYPALDIFLVENSRGISVINDSYVESTDFESLVNILSAVKIWNRPHGKIDADIDWDMKVRADIVFSKTVLPNALIVSDGNFIDSSLVQNTRNYIEKIIYQINECYRRELYDACAVLCRRLAEMLIIEVYESKKKSEVIKYENNYMMLDGLISKIINETNFDIGRNPKKYLDTIKRIGDQSAHGRGFTARHSDLEELKIAMRSIIESLIQVSNIQRKSE
jgi:predicted nucleotidyltransferase